MGGFGSGQYYRPGGKKHTVEQSREISTKRLLRWGYLDDSYHGVSLSWGQSSISAYISTHGDIGTMRLSYTITRWDKSKRDIEQRIPLVTTVPNFGGVRWWFECPRCRRRCGSVYLPPGQLYFFCRTCHDLTYTSTQTWDKRTAELKRNPDELLALVNKDDYSPGDLIRILKALDW